MICLKRILHPTDFSECSNRALLYACSLATQYNAELHIIHVIPDISNVIPPLAEYLPAGYQHQHFQFACEELASLPGMVVNYSGQIIRNVCEGIPFIKIIQYAKENDVDMVVMGTHGYSGIKHLIVGSVAENVVRKAHCPVLTLHPENYEFVMP